MVVRQSHRTAPVGVGASCLSSPLLSPFGEIDCKKLSQRFARLVGRRLVVYEVMAEIPDWLFQPGHVVSVIRVGKDVQFQRNARGLWPRYSDIILATGKLAACIYGGPIVLLAD